MNQIIEILAFLGAKKDYSYIDRLGNALDEISIMEAIRDAIRAYFALCRERPGSVDLDEGRVVMCPSITDAELERAVNMLASMLQNRPRTEIVKLARELSMRAYARIPSMIAREESGGQG
ncbi:MAG: hypothetical protein QXR24_03820 [Thermosphaera sp.]